MDVLAKELIAYGLEQFEEFLADYVNGAEQASLAALVPPNEDVGLEIAKLMAQNERLRRKVQKTLPNVLMHLSGSSPLETIQRASLLLGFCRAADAVPAAIALCDELDRRGRVEETAEVLRALAAQLPTEPLLNQLQRKAAAEAYTPVCVRALLRLDRARAAFVMSQLPRGRLAPEFLQSAVSALSADEQIEVLKELYCTDPPPPRSVLKAIEGACDARVRRVPDSELFEISTARSMQRFGDIPEPVRHNWLNAYDRTFGAEREIAYLVSKH